MEVRRRFETVQLDPLEYTPEFKYAIAIADQAFSSLSNGWTFLEQQELKCEILIHSDSFDEWEQFWADEAVYFCPTERQTV